MIDPIEQGKLDIIKKYVTLYKPQKPTPQRVRKILDILGYKNKVHIPNLPVTIYIFKNSIIKKLNVDLINSDPDNVRLTTQSIIREYGFFNMDFFNGIAGFTFSVDKEKERIIFVFISEGSNKYENMLINHELIHVIEYYAEILSRKKQTGNI